MANLRQRINFSAGTASNVLASTGQTTITGTNFPVPTAGYYVPIVLNPGYYGATNASGPEIVYVTSSGTSTVAVVQRQQESSTIASGTSIAWVAGPLISDFGMANMVTNGDVPNGSLPAGAIAFPSGVNVQTTNYTVVSGDVNSLIQMNNTTAAFVTLTGAYTVGQQITIYRNNVGSVTISGASGATVVSTGATAAKPTLRAQYSVATAICTSTTSGWLIVGDIS